MSLNLSFGGPATDDTHRAWAAELNALLAAHGHAPHADPAVPLTAWSVARRTGPLLDAADRVAGPWPVLDQISLNDAAFVPRPLDGVLTAAEGLTVAALPALAAELTRLAEGLAELGAPEVEVEAVAQFRHAVAACTAAGCALWLR